MTATVKTTETATAPATLPSGYVYGVRYEFIGGTSDLAGWTRAEVVNLKTGQVVDNTLFQGNKGWTAFWGVWGFRKDATVYMNLAAVRANRSHYTTR